MELTPIIFDAFMKPFETLGLHKRRKELMPKVSGKTLELGAGTGANFNYYNKKSISELTVMDLKINSRIQSHPFNKEVEVNYIEGDAEKLPFPDNSFDSVVATLIYCSVDNPQKALSEVYRVLKHGGKLYFMEHVLPEHQPYRGLLHTVNGAWHAVGKCNLNRETLMTIKGANFEISEFEKFGKGPFMFIKGIGSKVR